MSPAGPPDRTRDQDRSAFADILDDLIARSPGMLGAVLVDPDGETVDYSGGLNTFQIKVTAAHLQIIRAALIASGPLSGLGDLNQLCVRAKRRSFLVQPLDEGYALVLLLARNTFHVSPRPVGRAIRALAAEAGWSVAPNKECWQAIEVEESTGVTPERPRLVKTGTDWEALEVLGTISGHWREHGYRVRTASGAELTIVREPNGHWYVEG